MIKIKCLGCKREVKDCIYIVLPVSCRYNLGNGHLANQYVVPVQDQHTPDFALGYDCSRCGRRFPTFLNRKIAEYLRTRRILNKLKKD